MTRGGEAMFQYLWLSGPKVRILNSNSISKSQAPVTSHKLLVKKTPQSNLSIEELFII